MINLEHLTEEEKQIIMGVLQKDAQFMETEEERVKKLKTELYELRRKSAVKVDDEKAASSNDKVCARCREPLGTYFGSGEVCPRCQHKVCTNCKVTLPAPSGKKWLCTVCHKTLQIRIESGEVFKQGDGDVYGSDLVRMSLEKSKGASYDPRVIIDNAPQSPADSGFHGHPRNHVTSEVDTTYDDEYFSDEPSVVESIGPSVSLRGGYANSDAGKSRRNGPEIDHEGSHHGSADITLERLSHGPGSRISGEGDTKQPETICNASDSGIESVNKNFSQTDQIMNINRIFGRKANSRKESSRNPGPFSNRSSERPTSETSTTSHQRLSGKFRENRVKLNESQNMGNHLQITDSPIDHSDRLLEKRGASVAPLEQVRHSTPVSNPSSLPTTAPTSLTSSHSANHAGIHRSNHVHSHAHPSQGIQIGMHNYVESAGTPREDDKGIRAYAVGIEQAHSNVYKQTFLDDERFSDHDVPGDDSSRFSDTDAMSITSSSTVAWDAEMREQTSTKDVLQMDPISQLNIVESSNTGNRQNKRRDDLIDQNFTTFVSSGYDSTSSLTQSISSEKSAKSYVDNYNQINVNRFGVDDNTDPFFLSYLNSESYKTYRQKVDNTFHKYSDNSATLLTSFQTRCLPPIKFPLNDDDTAETDTFDEADSMPLNKDNSCSKELATKDIVSLQEQRNRVHSETSLESQVKDSPQRHMLVEQSRMDSGTDENELQSEELLFEDLGSINSDYVTLSSEKEEDEEKQSEISSIDPSLLDISSDDDAANDIFIDLSSGKKLLKFGEGFEVFKEEDSRDSTTEWGLGDESDGLVPLVLPLRSPEFQQVSSREELSGKEDDTRLESSIIKRFLGRPKRVDTPVPSIKKEYHDSDEDDEIVVALNLSQDSDSGEDTCIDLDPSHLQYSEEEKDAILRKKLAYNRSLMKALMRESEEELMLSDRERQTDDEITNWLNSSESRKALPGTTHQSSNMHERTNKNNPELEKKSESNERTKKGSGEEDDQNRQRRKKKTKSDLSAASVDYASKKGLVKHSSTEYGILSCSSDGKNQLYTLGGDKDASRKTVDMSRGRYSPLVDSGLSPQPVPAGSSPPSGSLQHSTQSTHQGSSSQVRPPQSSGPYIGQSLPKPHIHRKEPRSEKKSGQNIPRTRPHYAESSSSSSSVDDDSDDEVAEEVDADVADGASPVDVDGTKKMSAKEIWTMRAALSSQTADDSSDSELSVILEEPEEEAEEVYFTKKGEDENQNVQELGHSRPYNLGSRLLSTGKQKR